MNMIFFKQLPEIDVNAFIMERILNSNAKHISQRIYYNPTVKDNNNKNINLNLERVQHYSNDLTHNRNVSCLCWNEQNHVR